MDNKLQDKCNNQTKITDVKSLEQIWLGMVDVFQEEITSMLEGLPHLVWT